MKRITEIKAMRRPRTTRLLMVGWLVASLGKGITLNGDNSALQDMEASGFTLPGECSPMQLFHPAMALEGTLKADDE